MFIEKSHFRSIAIIAVLIISNFVLILKTEAQFTINENFRSNVIGGNIVIGAGAKLTSGVNDPINSGWLRLTNSGQFQKGYAYINSSFQSTLGILIDFEYKTWRDVSGEGGGDGFSVYLFDSSVSFSLGGYGGSLGYAPDGTVTPGLAGGYLGIGFDEFGNFSNPTQGRVGGPGLRANSIALRGPTTSSTSTTNKYLTGVTLNASTNPIGYGSPVFSRPNDNDFYRRVKISIVPIGTPASPKYTITVMWRTSPTGSDITLLTYDTIDPIPNNLKLGFAASTGGSTNYHEIRNLVITTPGGVRIDKKVDKLNAKVTDQLTYKIDVYNSTGSPITNLLLSDTLKSGDGSILPSNMIELNSITFDNNNNVGNAVAGFTTGIPKTTGLTNPLNINLLSMDANSVSTFTVVATIKNMPLGGVFKNVAALDISQTGITDEDLTNNTSTAITTIPNIDFIIEKNFVDKCADPVNGNTFNILVSNIGSTNSIANNAVMVKDTIPTGFTIMSVTNTGWTVSNIGNIYTFTRNDALASTSSYSPITIKVKAPATGVKWVNSATVSYAGIEADTYNNRGRDTLYAPAAAPVVISPINYCQGETAPALTAVGDKLLWYTSLAGTGSTTAPIPNTSTHGSTTYYVSNSNGICESSLTPIVVNVSKPSTATISGTTEVCKDSAATISFVGKDGIAPYTFTYNINGGNSQTVVSTKGDTATVAAVTDTAGTFTYNLVSVSDSKGCSVAQTGSANITVKQPLTATIVSVATICKDSTVNILFTGNGGVAPYSFTYNINGGLNKSVTTTAGDTVSVAASTTTSGTMTYNLVSVTDSKSCIYPLSSNVTVEVLDCFVSIVLPNAFTPNGDGLNDSFGAVTAGLQNIELDIYDRSGRLTHKINTLDDRWDGNMPSGSPAPVGVYFYSLLALGQNNQTYTRNGSVSLFREMTDASIRISPNLVSNSAKVDLSGISRGLKTISILNPSGKEVITLLTEDDTFDLNLSHLGKGLYILKVSGNEQVLFVKFIKL